MIADADKELLREQAAIRQPFEEKKGKVTKIPPPKDNGEAMAQLKGLYGATWYSIIKYHFNKDLGYKNNNEATKKAIKEQIEDLDNFIALAMTQRITTKDGVPKRMEELNDYDYYLRLKFDYYISKDLDNRDLGIDSQLSKVYGKYFLFYDYLKDELKKLEPPPIKEPDEILKQDIAQPIAGQKLKAAFKTYTDYDKVIKLLKDNDYIDSHDEVVIWKDKSKGCISKVHGLLEHLCKMGYIKGDKLSPVQKLSILKDTFIMEAKIYSVERYPKQKFIEEFSFILPKKSYTR
jgi:hypothetical protein